LVEPERGFELEPVALAAQLAGLALLFAFEDYLGSDGSGALSTKTNLPTDGQ
jgi:hypothetical protein